MRVQLEPRLKKLTERIIGAGFEVSKALGHGFLETVYKKALILELRRQGLAAVQEVPYKVHYLGEQTGTYLADLVVEDRVIVELKAVEALAQFHKGHLLNYLRASGLSVGLLFNFGTPRLEVRRVLA